MFSRSVSRITVAGLVAIGAGLGAASIQAQPVDAVCAAPADCNAPTVPFVDNRDGYAVNLEESLTHPIERTTIGRALWAVNVADASVVRFDVSTPSAPTATDVVKVALGPVSIRERPGTRQLWVVCQSSHALVVIDRSTRRVVDSMTVRAEPSDILFTPDGNRAFVTLSASDQIAEIDPDTLTVVANRDMATRFPTAASSPVTIEEPTSMALVGSELFVLSKESGNGTVPGGSGLQQTPIVDRWADYAAGTAPPPPDRDVVRFDISGLTEGNVGLWRAGSIAFDLEATPDGELWVSNMDYNNTLVGEFQFPKVGIAQHRLTHAPPIAPGATAPTAPPPSIDLNTDVVAGLAALGYRCAMPTEMLFAPDGQTAYVACYETHNVAVVDLGTGQVVAELRGVATDPITGEAIGFGARGLAADWNNGVVYAYSRGDATVQAYTIPAPAGTVVTPTSHVAAGFDITTGSVRQGRFHAINSLRSSLGVQSCNTCHIDGHLDRIAWDLSDFTGNLTGPAEAVGRRPKGTKVTMSLRGIEETPPFHWRGDRVDLSAFNPAFPGLLGAPELDPDELEQFESYVFSLSYPANPQQNLDRVYSATAISGFHFFQCKPSHRVRDHVVTPGAPSVFITCSECHGMSGASATNNQVNNDSSAPFPDDATQLRGLFDKESAVVDYTSLGVTGPLEFVAATGWGMANTGVIDSLADFVGPAIFPLLCQQELDEIVQLLDEFDTGLAPATAFAWTLDRGTAGIPAPPFDTLLKDQAILGHIDLIARGWMQVGAAIRPIGLLYDPAGDVFVTDTTGLGPFTYADLEQKAATGRSRFVILGTPVGSGYRLALDEEMDFVLDGDEKPLSTTASSVRGNADTDGDGFPDGYEIRLGSDPGNAASTPTDLVDPVISGEHVAWHNGTVAKLRWDTDEETTSRIEVFPAGLPFGTPISVREDAQPKRRHVLVARGLAPDRAYDIRIVATDPSGRSSSRLVSTATDPFQFPSVHVASTVLSVGSAPSGQVVPLVATFQVVDEKEQPVTGATVTFNAVEWLPGTAGSNLSNNCLTTPPTDALGFTSLGFDSTYVAGSGARVEVHVKGNATPQACPTRGVEDPSNRFYFTPVDGQFGHFDQGDLP